MNKFIFLATFLFAAALVVGEPPMERIEGAKLDPELLARVKDLLIYDKPPTTASGFSGGAAPHSSSPSSQYGTPVARPAAPLGSGAFSNPEEITLSDPIPAPLISTFDLPPTVEKRS